MRWLKEISREVKKRDKRYVEYKRHDYVAKELAKEYNKLYPKTLEEMCKHDQM